MAILAASFAKSKKFNLHCYTQDLKPSQPHEGPGPVKDQFSLHNWLCNSSLSLFIPFNLTF